MNWIIYPIIFLSGFTGLVYQITWQKYLSIYLGSHALSTTLTLSGFFLFLALGYYVLGKKGHSLGRNRILTYGYIEALIGVFAILSPRLFLWAYNIWPSFPSNSWQHILSSFGFAFVIMAFPTFLMGGTIPLLTQGLSRAWKQSHRVHAWVYGVNTLGAFLGSLISGFYFIEALGLEQTLNVTGMANCLIFIVVLLFSKLSSHNFSGFTPDTQKKQQGSLNHKLLSIAFLSGFVSFGVETLCIRVAGIALGSSNYTYCIVVSAFILSIALGSFLAGKLKDKKSFLWLVLNHTGIFITLCALYFALPLWPDLFMRVRMIFASTDINFNIYWSSVFLIIVLMLILPVSLLGATLPLLFQKLRSEDQHLNKTAGAMYAVNALGATLGALLAGYLFFYWLRLDQILLLLTLLSTVPLFLIGSFKQHRTRFALLAMAVLWTLVLLPSWQDSSFVPTRFSSTQASRSFEELKAQFDYVNNRGKDPYKYLLSDFGVNTYSVVLEDYKGDRSIYVNGKGDASTGKDGDMSTRLLNALIPLTIAKDPKHVFIIGLGAGMNTGTAAQFKHIESVKVSEIATGVIKALPQFEKWNFGLSKNMNKVTITNDDAYKVLQQQEEKFDLIFSEPSNTWVTGVEKLYTEEFLQVAASKLSQKGIYSQWFPLFAMDEPSFLAILKNFKQAFPHVTLWTTGGQASLIMASHQPLEYDMSLIKQRHKEYSEVYKVAAVKDARDLLYYQVWPDSVISELAKLSYLEHNLTNPSLSFRSARAFFSNKSVFLENLSEKYFIKKDKTFEDDPLLWQAKEEEFDKSFFERGVQFFVTMTRYRFAAGRMTLAMARKFDDWKKKEESKKKIAQYLYLQNPTDKTLPEPSSEKKDSLLMELFSRFRTLKKMREKAFFSQVLKAAPAHCQTEICYSSKLSILAFDESHLSLEDALQLKRQIKEETAQNRIEDLFKNLVDKSLN